MAVNQRLSISTFIAATSYSPLDFMRYNVLEDCAPIRIGVIYGKASWYRLASASFLEALKRALAPSRHRVGNALRIAPHSLDLGQCRVIATRDTDHGIEGAAGGEEGGVAGVDAAIVHQSVLELCIQVERIFRNLLLEVLEGIVSSYDHP
jgi:hypothetical protein